MYGSQTPKMFMLCTVMPDTARIAPLRAATLADAMRNYEQCAKAQADQAALGEGLKRIWRFTGLAAVDLLVNVSMKLIDKDAMI